MNENIVDFEEHLVALAASAAQMSYEDGEGVIPKEAVDVVEGSPFTIDLVIPTELESGDGRKVLKGGLTTRELPIPLLWQPKTGTGHDGSFIIGRIDSCDVTEEGVKNAKGVFDTGPYGREAERLVRNGMLRGVSADLDQFEVVDDEEMASMAAETDEDLSKKTYIKTARAMAATLLPKPAFQECILRLDDSIEEIDLMDGVYEVDTDLGDSAETVTSALIASAVPIKPPTVWFNDPRLKTETPLVVTDDGQVYGHIATWVQDHIGSYGVRPPRSKSGYAYFHTGLVRTEDNTDIAVGQLTLAGGHAALDLDARAAVRHYDDTGSAVADVHAGEDAYGIWVAGALRPGVTAEQVRIFRASGLSGDWRPINNRLEMVGVLSVNVPGFPIARACVASGSVTALVAAGASTLYRIQHNTDDLVHISERLQGLEKAILSEKKELTVRRVEGARQERKAALVASAEELRERFAPALAAKADRQAELQTQAEEIRKNFRLNVGTKYDEKLHPRDREGQWRKVLLKLSDILKDDDSGAVDAVKRAADAEDAGDDNGAEDAGREAKVSLNEAIERVGDGPVKDKLKQAVHDVEEAIGSAKEGGKPKSSITEDALSELIDKVIDELIGEKIDPKAMMERAMQRLKHLVDGKGVSPEELARLVAQKLEKQITPGIAQ